MPTVKLTPSTYYLSNSSYLSVSNESNMYANTDSTTYATVTNSRNSTTSYYIYLRGFDFSQVPNGAIVSGFTVRLKARESGVSTSSSYKPYLANGTSAINGSCSAITTTATVHEFSGISADWETLSGYGSNLGIRINCRRASRNTTGYMYIYGAEIDVTYALPIYHDVTVTNSTSATVTASDTHPLEGTDVTVTTDTLAGITVTDNGTDVTSQFVEVQDTAQTYTVETIGNYGFEMNSSGYYQSENKGISKTAAVCKVNIHVPVAATVTFSFINYAEQGYDFGVFGNLDETLSTSYYAAGSSGASITDSSYRLACNTSSRNTSSVQTLDYELTAGDHFIYVKYSKDDASDANNDTLQFKVSIALDEPFTPSSHYVYTISNVTADHAIVFAYASAGPTMWVKQNGAWVPVARAYVKSSGSWQQVSLDQAFDSSKNYVRG